MDKLDMVYDIVVDNRHSMELVLSRIDRIEQEIADLKEYKAKLTGICVTISAIIGLIPTLWKLIN